MDDLQYRRELELYSVSMTKHIRMALVHAYAKYGLFDKAKEVKLSYVSSL